MTHIWITRPQWVIHCAPVDALHQEAMAHAVYAPNGPAEPNWGCWLQAETPGWNTSNLFRIESNSVLALSLMIYTKQGKKIKISFLPKASFGLSVLLLHASVCLSVCVNHLFVHAITRDPFKLGSPNLDQRCKTPWLRSLLLGGAIDFDLQDQI